MFYSDFQMYQSHYSKNIKQIKSRTHFYSFNKDKDDIIIKRMAGNFDLIFDEDGKLIESIHYRNKKIIVKYLYEDIYDYERLYMVEEYTFGNSHVDTLSELFYDIKGRITLEKISHIFDEVEIQISTIYFEDKKIEFYDNINDNNYSGYKIYQLDNEKVIRETEYDTNRKVSFDYEYIYDHMNNITTIKSYDKNLVCDIEREFSDYNDLLEKIEYQSKDENRVRKYDYKFNDNHDWITRMTTDDGEPRFITDREIIYY